MSEADAAPLTEAGRRLLEQEAYNSRSFPLITVEAILAIEAEARASGSPTDAALGGARQRLSEAIAAERRDWHTVEVRPDDVAALLGEQGADILPYLSHTNECTNTRFGECNCGVDVVRARLRRAASGSPKPVLERLEAALESMEREAASARRLQVQDANAGKQGNAFGWSERAAGIETTVEVVRAALATHEPPAALVPEGDQG